MDIKKAQQIINSKGVIRVEYNNEPIWIENLDEKENAAYIKKIYTDEECMVPLNDLKES